MPFRIDCGPEHPVVAAILELGAGPHTAAVLAERAGLSAMDLFDELDVLELGGCLRWSSADDAHELLAIDILELPQPERTDVVRA